MRDADQISAFVTDRIDQIGDRPLMYGGTAEGIDLILHVYHPHAPEAGIARYVVDRWREIGARLALPS